MICLNSGFGIFSLAGIRVDLPKSEVAAQLRMCPHIAVGREILGVQGQSIEQTSYQAWDHWPCSKMPVIDFDVSLISQLL